MQESKTNTNGLQTPKNCIRCLASVKCLIIVSSYKKRKFFFFFFQMKKILIGVSSDARLCAC